MAIRRYIVRHPHTRQYLDYRPPSPGKGSEFYWTDDPRKALLFQTDYAALHAGREMGVPHPDIEVKEISRNGK